MLTQLTSKSIFFHKQTAILLLSFFGIRVLSYTLNGYLFTQAVIVFSIVMGFGIIYFKKPDWAWYVLIGELFLGGAGHFLEFSELSIRTVLVGTFLALWTTEVFLKGEIVERLKINKRFSIVFFFFFFMLLISIIRGIFYGNPLVHIIQDSLPFMYLFLIFPALHLLKRQSAQEYIIRLIVVFIIGSAILSIATFALFSTGIVELQEPFYKWFRDVSMGKITDMGAGFFRIVLPEHLIITPMVLVIASLLMRDEKHHKMWRVLLVLSLLILVLNFSRAYLLGLAVGYFIIKYKHKWNRWLKVSVVSATIFILTFFGLSILASSGKSFGLQMFGVRIASFAVPEVETSTATRMSLLSPIFEKIQQSPILGSGIGGSLKYKQPLSSEYISTRHFDWGYLEMVAEMGLIGAISLLSLYLYALVRLIRKTERVGNYEDFYVGLIGALVSLLVINITTPALFHVFGIFLLVFILALVLKSDSVFDRMIVTLYRIFNKKT